MSALSHSLAAVNGGEKDRSGVRGLWKKEGRYRDVHEQQMGYRRKRGRIRKVDGKVGRWDLPRKKSCLWAYQVMLSTVLTNVRQ